MTAYISTPGNDTFTLSAGDTASFTPGGSDVVKGTGSVFVDWSSASSALQYGPSSIYTYYSQYSLPTISVGSRLSSTSGSLEFNSWNGFLYIKGSEYGDSVAGSSSFNYDGGAGNDVVTASLGNDILDAGGGINTLSYAIQTYRITPAGGSVSQPYDFGGATVALGIVGPQVTGAGTDTIRGFQNLIGSVGSDRLAGDAGNNRIEGGLSGNDTLLGGGGDDVLIGSGGNDFLVGDSDFTGVVGAGADQLFGGQGDDRLFGQGGNDILWGGWGNDSLAGEDGDDRLYGEAGNDLLNGGAGVDFLYGGTEDDTYIIDDMYDVVIEDSGAAAGRDTIISSIDIGLSDNVEYLVLTGAAVTGIGNSLDNRISGNAQDNVLIGAGGADAFFGGSGNDTYFIDDSGDFVSENPGEGTRDIIYSEANYTLPSNVEVLVLAGGALTGIGNTASNEIYGNALDNLLDGQGGADAMFGGLGNDTYIVDSSSDFISELSAAGRDTIIASANYTLPDNVESLRLVGGAIVGIGNSGNNEIYGNDQSNFIDGGLGADVMVGGSGNDTYFVDSAADYIFENVGEGSRDIIYSSDNYTIGANIEVLALTGSAVTGVGNNISNEIYGNDQANILVGAGGADAFYGGNGNDTYIVDSSDDFVSEIPGQGARDIIYSSASFTLPDAVEVLVLTESAVTAVGNSSNNEIYGNAQNNTIIGGQGDDIMFGGVGLDTFIFQPGFGHDVIADFRFGQDTIAFSRSQVADFSAVQAQATQVGSDTLIALNGSDSVTLQNVLVSSLNPSDYLFF